MEQKARITNKGQVTIPNAVRQALGITEGGSLLFEVKGDEVRVRAARQPVSFADYARAWCDGEGMSWDEVNDYVRDLRGHDDGEED